jgi:hypothetical protein
MRIAVTVTLPPFLSSLQTIQAKHALLMLLSVASTVSCP